MCNLKFIKPTLKSLQEESWKPHENPDFLHFKKTEIVYSSKKFICVHVNTYVILWNRIDELM